MRALRRFDEESFVVKLPEGHQIAVPAWMLDAIFCSQLPQRDHPLIALEALLELAELIEAHAFAFFSDRFRIWAITSKRRNRCAQNRKEIIVNQGWPLRKRSCGKNFPNPVEFAAAN